MSTPADISLLASEIDPQLYQRLSMAVTKVPVIMPNDMGTRVHVTEISV